MPAAAHEANRLKLFANHASLADPNAFAAFVAPLRGSFTPRSRSLSRDRSRYEPLTKLSVEASISFARSSADVRMARRHG